MSVAEQDTVKRIEHVSTFAPDTNDPTVGRVAISRELASEWPDRRPGHHRRECLRLG